MNLFDEINSLSALMTDEQREQMMQEAIDPEAMRRLGESITKRLASSTVLRQYFTHLSPAKTGAVIKNTLPWHAEGERQYAALMAASTVMDLGARAVFGKETEEVAGHPPARFLALGSAPLILAAQLYLWRIEMENLADEAPLPRHAVSQDALPHPFMFWSRDVARGNYEFGESNWTFIGHGPEGFRIISDLIYGPNDHRISINEVRYGLVYPDDFPEEVQRGIGCILKRLSFLNSKYVSPETERLPRQWRKEATRHPSRYPNADPQIRIVKLRRETQQKVDAAYQQKDGRVHSGHWWVSGHHRAQWYPSKQAHEVIWIEPYLKGSPDEPEVKHLYSVVR